MESVKREVNLLIKEYDGEKTYIKSNMWRLKSRKFVSIYCGRICVGVIMMNTLKKGTWNIANAVIDKRARRMGLGKLLANVALRSAFTTGCEKMYLGAELTEVENKEGDWVPQKPSQSGAVKFWKNLKFRQIPKKEYNRLMKAQLEAVVPMRMTARSPAVKELPHLEDTIQKLFPRLKEVSKSIDGKERVPMLRMCTSELGDVKITENRGKNAFIFH